MDLSFLTGNIGLLAGVGSAGVTLTILKMVPNAKIYSWVEKSGFAVGRCLTLGLSSSKSPLKKIWNSKIEHWFVDAIENIFGALVHGILRGLRID